MSEKTRYVRVIRTRSRTRSRLVAELLELQTKALAVQVVYDELTVPILMVAAGCEIIDPRIYLRAFPVPRRGVRLEKAAVITSDVDLDQSVLLGAIWDAKLLPGNVYQLAAVLREKPELWNLTISALGSGAPVMEVTMSQVPEVRRGERFFPPVTEVPTTSKDWGNHRIDLYNGTGVWPAGRSFLVEIP